jgi:hypothetical protein
MTLMLDLVADTRRMVYGSMADQLNFLSAEALAGATTLEFVMDVTPITPGMILSSGLNVYYVISVDQNTKTVTVYPSYDNSLAEALPVGSPVMIRPRVTDWLLFNNLNDSIRQMSSPTMGLYQERYWEATTDSVWQTYEVPEEAANMVDLLRVSVKVPTSTDLWADLPPNSARWQFGAGVVRITSYGMISTDLRFYYKAPFVEATSLTDDVEVDLGLGATMTDIPPLGAAARLLITTESRRAQTHNQSDPRRATEVQPGQNTGAARDLDRAYRQRIGDEYVRLLNRNPYVKQM